MDNVISAYGSGNPFSQKQAVAKATIGGSEDFYGAFSIEKFCDQSPLSYTHEDAQGWLDYVTQFKPANFWFQDGNVRPWAYYEDYDNWQDTYGMDAVLAVYHSGHGGMDSNGKFYLPMGADWGGLGCTVTSDRMRLGNEQANYIFLSTCLSCRVLDGHSPIRTWSAANLGFRMLFGYETISWDNPNYGKFFWQEWNKGQSFSSAWLNASWRIAHDQAPSVAACGATAQEAADRLFNERTFEWGHVSSNYWHWRWYNAAKSARQASLNLPQQLLVAGLAPTELTEGTARLAMERFNLDLPIPQDTAALKLGFSAHTDKQRFAIAPDGSLAVRLARPNRSNRRPLSVQDAIAKAQAALTQYGLNREVELVLDCVRVASEAAGTQQGSGSIDEPRVTETLVQFRQVINGLPVITPHAGTVRVAIDNDGTVTQVHSSTRIVDQLHNRPRNPVATPQEGSAVARARAADPANYERLLSAQWSDRLVTMSRKGAMPQQTTILPNTTEVGYDLRGDQAVLTAQRAIEVDCGNGYRKRYWVNADLLA